MAGCEFCGGPVDEDHHPTGRDERNEYLDPAFKRHVCHDHHDLLGDDLKTLEMEKVPRHERLTWLDRIQVRLRRLAAYLARLDAATGVVGIYGAMAAVFTSWADELAQASARLDERDPSWREDPSFYPDE